MTYLFFDTETTGLPDFKQLPSWAGQPHICQLGAILTDRDGKVKAELNMLVRPDGWSIPPEASAIHGITHEDAMRYGLSIRGVLGVFNRLMSKAELVIAHNVRFDRFMVLREASACEFKESDFAFQEFCTMEKSAGVLKIPPTARMLAYDMKKYKNPNLMEAYLHFFGRQFEGAHDAMADVRACRDVFFALKALEEKANVGAA
jgi:DNA polymerase-3 subunit epsilon